MLQSPNVTVKLEKNDNDRIIKHNIKSGHCELKDTLNLNNNSTVEAITEYLKGINKLSNFIIR